MVPLHPGKPHAFGPFTLDIHPVRHISHAHAYGAKISAGGVSAGFTCDSLADADPWFYKDTACVFHDCSFKPYYPDTVHAHFEQLCRYPAEWRNRTYLVHYGDEVAAKREEADWQQTLAATGMRLALPFEPLRLS